MSPFCILLVFIYFRFAEWKPCVYSSPGVYMSPALYAGITDCPLIVIDYLHNVNIGEMFGVWDNRLWFEFNSNHIHFTPMIPYVWKG